MPSQEFFNAVIAIFGVLAAIIGFCITWWVNNIWSMVKVLQTDVSSLHVELAGSYVKRQELQATFDRIFDALDDIRKEVSR